MYTAYISCTYLPTFVPTNRDSLMNLSEVKYSYDFMVLELSNTASGYIILFYFTRCRLEGTTCFGLPYRPSSGHKIYPRKLYSKFLSFSGPCIISIFLLIYFQRDATLHSLFIYGKRSTCFGWYLQPSSGAHITVFTVSGTC